MPRERHSDLRQSVVLVGGGLALLVAATIAAIANSVVTAALNRQADRRLVELAAYSASLANQFARDREREVRTLAELPSITAAARRATARAEGEGLVGVPVPALEDRFQETRALGGSPEAAAYLQRYVARSPFAEIFFTNRYGHTVTGSNPTSDFVQSDETWWRRASSEGLFQGDAEYDESAGVAAIEIDAAIPGPPGEAPWGVLKAVLQLDRLRAVFPNERLSGATRREVVDRLNRLVIGPTTQLLAPYPDSAALGSDSVARFVRVSTASGDELVASAPSNGGRWRAVVRQPVSEAYAAGRTARGFILVAAGILFVVALFVMVWLGRWRERRVTQPVEAAGKIAGRIAEGDLSVTVTGTVLESEADTAVASLLASVGGMVGSLRSLVTTMRRAADEAAALAEEISASTQEMTASTEEMAATTQDLSRKAGEQAALVKAAADDATRILEIATRLAEGARETARRNADLAQLADEHRQQLQTSTDELSQLAHEVELGAGDAEQLARSSADIQKFVAQTKAIATQTNMLALNAAIEASRAGAQGRGFGVVADEVRKLATQAAQAATNTAETVRGVLSQVQHTRERLLRLGERSAAARDVAETAARGLERVADEAQANRSWTDEISQASSEVRTLVEEIANRLRTLAVGTDSFAAAAQEIAASSEQQSASTQEIAGSSAQLAEAAEKLLAAVSSFRLQEGEERKPPNLAEAAD